MSDASTAAKAIQDQHLGHTNDWGTWCVVCSLPWPCDSHREVGVVLARINEAIQHLEAIRLDLAMINREFSAWVTAPASQFPARVPVVISLYDELENLAIDKADGQAVAALACLRNEEA